MSQSKNPSINIENGAKCENYWWCQSHGDIDMTVTVSPTVVNGRQVKVTLTCDRIRVSVYDVEGELIGDIGGQLSHPIDGQQSAWTLHSGQYIHISMEKVVKSWWNELIVNEKQIIVGPKKREVLFDELSSEEMVVIRELTHQQRLKLDEFK